MSSSALEAGDAVGWIDRLIRVRVALDAFLPDNRDGLRAECDSWMGLDLPIVVLSEPKPKMVYERRPFPYKGLSV